MLLEVSNRVAKEAAQKMKNCELTVILHNFNGHVHDRVKQIVITAGKGEDKIQCSKNTNGDIQWECQDSEREELKEHHRCATLTISEINKILNNSTFLENKIHRQFVASELRKAVEEEMGMVRQNCTLTIELEDLESPTGIAMKYIIVTAGKGENKIFSSKDKPWRFEDKATSVSIAHTARSAFNTARDYGQGIMTAATSRIVSGIRAAIGY
ncbi:uncharacterized protein LOC110459021 [Mizuhopecten yessoensis]|uniref:uncharacterized protein LOC110459021 n=1 Tax=Mizuhopecten yessoensis TaxID=6573 RepID=UPI000B45DA71|nr:uncharacterized protein LOC110459021 [Mizuhopecten yessoensis]